VSPLVVVAGTLVPLAVVVALAPAGSLTRRAMRRAEPPRLPASSRSARPRPSSSGHSASRGSGALGGISLGAAAVGRSLRRAAGRPADPAADGRAGLALVVAVVAAVVVSPVVALPAAALCIAVPAVRRRATRRARERAVRAAVPDTVDLFRLAVGAGLSVHQAVEAVAARAPEPVDVALDEVVRRVALGERLGDAFDALWVLGDPALPLAAALRGAARHGAPLADALERVAVDARVLRRRRAEEDARRLPVQMLFPLVMCVLPAFGLLAVVPLLLASLRSLQL
jgi:tight adherence protein C